MTERRFTIFQWDFNPSCLDRAKTMNFRVIFGDALKALKALNVLIIVFSGLHMYNLCIGISSGRHDSIYGALAKLW